MRNFILPAFAIALCFGSACSDKEVGQRWEVENAQVLSASPRPRPSGILSTFVELDVKTDDKDEFTLYVQYMGADQFIPTKGMVCNAEGHFDYINGESAISFPIKRGVLHRIVEKIECDS